MWSICWKPDCPSVIPGICPAFKARKSKLSLSFPPFHFLQPTWCHRSKASTKTPSSSGQLFPQFSFTQVFSELFCSPEEDNLAHLAGHHITSNPCPLHSTCHVALRFTSVSNAVKDLVSSKSQWHFTIFLRKLCGSDNHRSCSMGRVPGKDKNMTHYELLLPPS